MLCTSTDDSVKSPPSSLLVAAYELHLSLSLSPPPPPPPPPPRFCILNAVSHS